MKWSWKKKKDTTTVTWEKGFVKNMIGWIIFTWIVAAILFGWSVKNVFMSPTEKSTAQKVNLLIASIPDMMILLFNEYKSKFTGEYIDKEFAAGRTSDFDTAQFRPLTRTDGSEVDGFYLKTTDAPVRPGWRLIAGVAPIGDEVENVAYLLDEKLVVVREWLLDDQKIDGEAPPRAKFRRFVHGIDILPDASLVFTFDGSASLQRYDKCGKRLWGIPGPYHHMVKYNPDTETVWSFPDLTTVAEIDVQDGTILRSFTMDDIRAANPKNGALDGRIKQGNDLGNNSKNTPGKLMDDAYHLNDVEPLTQGMAEAFPQFSAGDLLISARSLNLLFVIDPDTLAVKWWRVGATQRQHDPDWMPDGTISVFNNRMGMDFSEITIIDPKDNAVKAFYAGDDKNQFYSRIRGEQQIFEDGSLLITSTQQGRIIETNPDGQIVMEIMSVKPSNHDKIYNLSTAQWYPEHTFKRESLTCE